MSNHVSYLASNFSVSGNRFEAGELGPGTIVGSAAYNLMAISAICIVALPSNESKRISQISVFCITAAFSTFAYIWLIIILIGSSKNEIEVWEGTLTLVFFFLLVVISYMADVKLFERCLNKKPIPRTSADQEMSSPLKAVRNDYTRQNTTASLESIHPEWREIERQAQLDFPKIDDDDLAKLIAFRYINVALNQSADLKLKFLSILLLKIVSD